MSAGKGSKFRKVDKKKFDFNWDLAFGKKEKSEKEKAQKSEKDEKSN